MSQTDIHHDFLNKAFFEKVIRSYIKDDKAEVIEFTIQSGSKAGESFASDLLRASIIYRKVESDAESISVIVKVMPEKAGGEIDGKRLFMTEMKMYGHSLIDINRVLVSAGDTIKLFPR